MPEIGFIHGSRQYFCLFFLVGMLLHFTTYYPSFSSKLHTTTTMCQENDRKFLLDIFSSLDTLPNCTRRHYNYSFLYSFLDCCNIPGISCSNLSGRIIELDFIPLLYNITSSFSCEEDLQFILKPSLLSLVDLSSLHLDLDAVSFSKGFQSFIHSFPNLLHLYVVSGEGEMAIPQALRNLTKLETFEVYAFFSSMYAETLGMFSRLTSLKRLILSGVALDEATDWLHVVSNLPRLVHLELILCNLPDATRHSRPPSINSSKSLVYLDLSSNNLSSSSSLSWIFNHSSLVSLSIYNNQFTGSVPDELGGMRSLSHLDLSQNYLKSRLPGLGQLSMLSHFDVSSNSLEDDLGISHLGNLSYLSYLDLSFNSLTLNVNSSWVPPFCLSTIGLASCGLGSRFPEWLRTQTNYSWLDLSNTGISGTIPYWFWNLSSEASYISLSGNRLHGKLSTDLFSDNKLPEDNTPPFFSDITHLDLSRNSFSGPISFLCSGSNKFSYRSHIDLSQNKFSGGLPDCWSELSGVLGLDLSDNNFSGQLPSSLSNLSGLQCLHLGNNNFSGKLPLSLCNLTNLVYLDLGDNLFSGEISACLGNMSSDTLNALSLRNNSFSGRIPPQLCNTDIQILDLSMNNLSGVIPQCLCKLQAMTVMTPLFYDNPCTKTKIVAYFSIYKDYISFLLKGHLYSYAKCLDLVKILDLSSNSLTGEIPAEISCLTGLISLNFSGNNLSGSITSKIGSLESLESLDLSNNHLSGEIPSTISNLNFLGTLSLANNNFSGRIPSGTQIQGFNASTFAGNPGLCGEPLPDKCPGDGDGKGSSVNEDLQNLKENDDDRSFYLGLCISVVLGFITGFWAFCGALVLKRSWRVAYFRAWIHAYDTLYVMVMVRIRRRYIA